jgi:hypothetical protein
MAEAVVLIGLDADCPRIQFGDSERQRQRLIETVRALKTTADTLESAGAAWTLFANGGFLEFARHVGGDRDLAALLARDSVEAAHHGFSHRPLDAVKGKPYMPLDVSELDVEIGLTALLLRRLGVDSCDGFRAPLGCPGGLGDPQLAGLRAAGFSYVTSDLRASACVPHAPLRSSGNEIRQPRGVGGLLEIPGHGLHDTVFERAIDAGIPATAVRASAVSHYLYLVAEAVALSEEADEDVYVGLVLHPSSLSVYDTEGELLDRLASLHSGVSAIRVCSYGEAARRLEAPG